MRGYTILFLYAESSRGLLITPVYPTYEVFYYPVIICREQQRTIIHPSPLQPMRCSTILLSYAESNRGLLFTPVHHHPTYEVFYYPVIICREQLRTINHPSPPPPMRCSTILLWYAESSWGLLITPVHPHLWGVLLSCYDMPRAAEDY